MYLAGTASLLLLWGVLTAVYFVVACAMGGLAPDFVTDCPWCHGPVWAVLGPLGMIGSSIIGRRAGERNAGGAAARSAGVRAFQYWVAALLPGIAGIWNSEQAGHVPYTVSGVIFLGRVLFGILYRPALAVVGVALAVAVPAPYYLAGDRSGLISRLAVLSVGVPGAAWIRRSGRL